MDDSAVDTNVSLFSLLIMLNINTPSDYLSDSYKDIKGASKENGFDLQCRSNSELVIRLMEDSMLLQSGKVSKEFPHEIQLCQIVYLNLNFKAMVNHQIGKEIFVFEPTLLNAMKDLSEKELSIENVRIGITLLELMAAWADNEDVQSHHQVIECLMNLFRHYQHKLMEMKRLEIMKLFQKWFQTKEYVSFQKKIIEAISLVTDASQMLSWFSEALPHATDESYQKILQKTILRKPIADIEPFQLLGYKMAVSLCDTILNDKLNAHVQKSYLEMCFLIWMDMNQSSYIISIIEFVWSMMKHRLTASQKNFTKTLITKVDSKVNVDQSKPLPLRKNDFAQMKSYMENIRL